MSASSPMWDQTIAACDEAAAVVQRMAAVQVPQSPLGLAVFRRWALGLAVDGPTDSPTSWTSCGHVPNPQLCFGLAHLPGHLLCSDCWLREVEEADNSCDWCGAGVSDRLDLYPFVQAVGPAIVLVTLCHWHVMTPDSTVSDWRSHVRNTVRSACAGGTDN